MQGTPEKSQKDARAPTADSVKKVGNSTAKEGRRMAVKIGIAAITAVVGVVVTLNGYVVVGQRAVQADVTQLQKDIASEVANVRRDIAGDVQDVQTAISLMLTRVSLIENNRFTTGDGLEVWKEIGKIREDMATFPREVPPQWFETRVDDLSRKVDELQRIATSTDTKITMHMAEGHN